MQPSRSTLVGVALICFANLLLSILITRLFSATMFYHFTFMAVGLAMFGIAASGVFVFLRATYFAANVESHMARFSRYFALSTFAAVVYATRFPIFSGGRVPDWSATVLFKLVTLIVLTAVPFFLAGVVVSLALTAFKNDVNRVYSYDLFGAALAAVAAGIVLGLLGGPTGILFVAVVGLVAGACFDPSSSWKRVALPVLGAAFVGFNIFVPVVKVGSVKWEKKLAFEEWNTFSRITVDRKNTIKIDAGAATHIESLRDLAPDMDRNEITSFGLHTWATPPGRVLVIGPGGGRDVLFALASGAQHVTAVEINPLIATAIMRDRYAEASGHLYSDPRVTVVVDEGRSFVRRSSDMYDVVQASLVDTWAATSAGAFALTENTLYTLEAFEDYYRHLTDRGIVTMTRFYGAKDGLGVSESQRLIVLAAGALERSGIRPGETRRHIFFVAKDNQGTLVVKKTPFSDDELQRLEERAAKAGFTVVVSPRTDGSSLLEKYVDQGAWSSLVSAARDDLRPPTDDRPFFFLFTKFGDLFQLSGKKMYDAGLWMVVSLATVLSLGLLFVVLPLLVRFATHRKLDAPDSPKAQAITLAFFGLVGFAFMAVEIALLQRFTLFLGHPTYSLIVVLFVILVSTALGARLSSAFPIRAIARIVVAVGLALCVLNVVYGAVLGDVLRSWVGFPREARVLISVAIIAPCGLMMGAMIPSAIRMLAMSESALIPWGWGVNGAMSVIGTSIATLIAMYVGFSATFFVGAVSYLVAGLLGALMAREYRRSWVETTP